MTLRVAVTVNKTFPSFLSEKNKFLAKLRARACSTTSTSTHPTRPLCGVTVRVRLWKRMVWVSAKSRVRVSVRVWGEE